MTGLRMQLNELYQLISLRILEFYVRKTEESTTTHSLTIRTRQF